MTDDSIGIETAARIMGLIQVCRALAGHIDRLNGSSAWRGDAEARIIAAVKRDIDMAGVPLESETRIYEAIFAAIREGLAPHQDDGIADPDPPMRRS